MDYINGLTKIVRENHYIIVHIHKNSASMAMDAWAARRGGAARIIGHSHNTRCDIVWQHYLFKPFVNVLLTDRFACSVGAGKWIFGRHHFTVINNAIDTEQFEYSIESRMRIRYELGITNEVAVGFVGRLVKQKNIVRLIEIFYEISKINDKTVLIVVGDGSLSQEIENKIADLSIESKVYRLGTRNDVNEIYSAMDVLVLPSLYEGLGNVQIEAQATGLLCVISDKVPRIDIDGLVETIELEQNNEVWAQRILDVISRNIESRKSWKKKVASAGYDINEEAKKLQDFYTL